VRFILRVAWSVQTLNTGEREAQRNGGLLENVGVRFEFRTVVALTDQG